MKYMYQRKISILYQKLLKNCGCLIAEVRNIDLIVDFFRDVVYLERSREEHPGDPRNLGMCQIYFPWHFLYFLPDPPDFRTSQNPLKNL
jgi:hypothetical protein